MYTLNVHLQLYIYIYILNNESHVCFIINYYYYLRGTRL